MGTPPYASSKVNNLVSRSFLVVSADQNNHFLISLLFTSNTMITDSKETHTTRTNPDVEGCENRISRTRPQKFG